MDTFVVRVWRGSEPPSPSSGLRGSVQRVGSERVVPFQDAEGLLELLRDATPWGGGEHLHATVTPPEGLARTLGVASALGQGAEATARREGEARDGTDR